MLITALGSMNEALGRLELEVAKGIEVKVAAGQFESHGTSACGRRSIFRERKSRRSAEF
jgi:hypothetical protein